MPVPWTVHVHKQLGKGLDHDEIGNRFGKGASTACEKVNTQGTDKDLFRLVPMSRHGARVLPLGTAPKFVLGHQQKTMFRLVPVPGHGNQVRTRPMSTDPSAAGDYWLSSCNLKNLNVVLTFESVKGSLKLKWKQLRSAFLWYFFMLFFLSGLSGDRDESPWASYFLQLNVSFVEHFQYDLNQFSNKWNPRESLRH